MNWRTFFIVAAIYDLVLGAAFFFAYGPIWELLEIELPNNIAYKFAFASLSFYYFAIGELLHPTFLVFGALDVLFLIGFWRFLSQTTEEPAA